MQRRNWKHVEAPQEIVHVNHRRNRNGYLAIGSGRLLEDGKHNTQMFIVIAKKNFVISIGDQREDADSIPWKISRLGFRWVKVTEATKIF